MELKIFLADKIRMGPPDFSGYAQIDLFIDSPGGPSDLGIAWRKALQNAQATGTFTSTWNIGIVQSAATLPFFGSQHPRAVPNTSFLFHPAFPDPETLTSIPEGSYLDYEIRAQAENETRTIIDLLAEDIDTNNTVVEGIVRREFSGTAEKLLEWGWIEEISFPTIRLGDPVLLYGPSLAPSGTTKNFSQELISQLNLEAKIKLTT